MHDLTPLGFSPTVARRLYSKVVIADNGCHVWTGSKLQFGHGHMSRGSRGSGFEPTHRVAWMLENGPIEDGLMVLHKCDNPPCCNPDHLFLGTQLDNMRDMWNKGRQVVPRGEAHYSSRLTADDVAEMRRLAPILNNNAELGRRFGVSKQHARAIVVGTKWAS